MQISAVEESLLDRLGHGRAALVLGQRHTPGYVDSLIQDIAALSGEDPTRSLAEQLQVLGSPQRLYDVRRAFLRPGVTEALLDVAGCPWSIVITSAIDPLVDEAFGRVGTSRPIRTLYPSQVQTLTPSRGPSPLTVVRLYGRASESVNSFLPPLTEGGLRERQVFEVPFVLRQLPYLAAEGCLVVDGIGEDDWLDVDTLALACRTMPERSVHWFLGEELAVDPRERADFGDTLIVHEGTLAEFLRRNEGNPAIQDLRAARDAYLSPSDRVITISKPGPPRRQLALTPTEWRNISQVGIVLDDNATAPPPPLNEGDRRIAFREFLRGGQRPPDWAGVVRGFLFEREIAQGLVEKVEKALLRIGAVNPETSEQSTASLTVVRTRRPILVSGPPACGKTRLLHWLAVELRRRGHMVMYALPIAGRIRVEAVERVCRVLEGKGAESIALIVDDLDDAGYGQIAEALAAAGRNVIVVGAQRTGESDVSVDVDSDPKKVGDQGADGEVLSLSGRLTSDRPSEVGELGRFSQWLTGLGEEIHGLTPRLMQDRYFLLLLKFLLPDTRGNVRLSVEQAYDRVARAFDDAVQVSLASNHPPRTELVDQLREVAAQLFPGMEFGVAQLPVSTYKYSEETRDALDLILLCARLERPLPVDLLLRAMGSAFIAQYPQFAAHLGVSELLFETEMGELDVDHPELARLALAAARPWTVEQLDLLTLLVDAVRWDDSKLPGDDPHQDYAIELLQLVGPRGVAEREFSSSLCLERLAKLLANIREDRSAPIPKLLLLEAQTLRLLADRDSDYQLALERTKQAIVVLQLAEAILIERPATVARNHELMNVLTMQAVVHGYIIGAHLRQMERLAENGDEHQLPDLREKVFNELGEVEFYVGRTRGLATPSFYPLDVDFWSLKDIFEQMPGLSEIDRARLLARMATVLDSATEEPIEPRQVPHYERRRSKLAELEGQEKVSEELAESMRRRGDLSGYCQIIRSRVYLPRSHTARSADLAAVGLRRLLSLGDQVWSDRGALALAHHLWMTANLPSVQLGHDPVLAACSPEQWRLWRRILEARCRLPEDEENAYIRFCLAWALLQSDEPRLALEEFGRIAGTSIGNRRRVGCLAVITTQEGKARSFRAVVRRRQGSLWIAYLPELVTEIRLPPWVAGLSGTDLQVGVELHLPLGLNYRGLLPWEDPATVATRNGREPASDSAVATPRHRPR